MAAQADDVDLWCQDRRWNSLVLRPPSCGVADVFPREPPSSSHCRFARGFAATLLPRRSLSSAWAPSLVFPRSLSLRLRLLLRSLPSARRDTRPYVYSG